MRFHPLIYVPKTIEIPVEAPRLRFRGFFTVELIDAKSGLIKRVLHFENLITNAGLDRIGANNIQLRNMLAYMGVGTGSTAPANTDTALVAEISPTTTHRTNSNGGIVDVIASGASFTYWSVKRVRLFLEAQANGNLTEVGWFDVNSGGTMWTRQLFKDGGGTPTTIVKTSSDQLRVTYELRVYPPTSDVVNTVTISGTMYTYTIRASEIDDQSTWGGMGSGILGILGDFTNTTRINRAFETDTLGTTSGSPAGSPADADSTSLSSYSSSNYFLDSTSVWEPTSANFATGIGSMKVWGANPSAAQNQIFQVSFSPKFAKDNTKRLTITERRSWGRYP